MKNIFKVFLVVLLFSITSACTTLKGVSYNDSFEIMGPEKGLVNVFRTPSLTGAAWPVHFYVDGKLFAELVNGGFNSIELPPGKHKISSGPAKQPEFHKTEVDLKAGQVHYVQIYRGMPDTFSQLPAANAKNFCPKVNISTSLLFLK